MAEVEYNYSDGISKIILNRPEKKNSINEKVLEGLESSLIKAKEDQARVLIFEGSGNFFCAGADINMFFNMNQESASLFSERGNKLMDSIENFEGITISAIEGGALGGGLELALSTDIRIAQKDVKLGLPEITLGIFPGWGGIKRIVRAVGFSNGKYMVLTGKYFSGEDAWRMGLINILDSNPKESAINLANDMKRLSKESLSMIKRLLKEDIYSTKLEAMYFGKILNSESTKPYLEKFKKK